MSQFQERRVSADETKWNGIGEDLQLTADLLIVANGDYFGVQCDPREFPFQSFARCAEVLKKANKDGRFPPAVVRFYSVSYIKEDPSRRAWVLPQSPLLPNEQAIMMSHDSVFEALNRQLSDDMARSVYSLLDNAIEVLKKESLCEEFILWGSCAFQAENSCHRSLYSNPRDSERGVRNALEELLYHRITRWKVNDMSFSLLLQQVDLADALNIGEIFGRNIISRIDWGRLNPVKTKPFGYFWDILRLRSALRGGDLALAIELMWHIHPMQLGLDSPEIVISSSDEFLIKDNWRKIHLKYFFPCLVAFDALPLNECREITEAAKTILATIARYVLGSLQKIQSCRYATLRMTWNKRPDILIRRVLDMLAICLCNMQQYAGNKIRPGPENEFLTGIIQAWNFWCHKKTINAQESELDINKFMVIFADAFSSSYSGIEILALYQKSSLRQPYSKFRIMRTTWKVKRGQFQSLSSFNKRSSEQKHPQAKAFKHERVESGNTDDGDQAALTKAEIIAASMIRSFWKKYWPILVKRREFEKTDEGMATKVMDGLCKTLRDTVDEVLPKKRLSLDNTLSELIVKMKAEDLKWNEREMLDENYQSLRQSRADMVDVKALVLHEEVVACPVEELRYRLTEAEALATQIDKSVGDIMGEITRIEDQVAGRRASDSLKTPGEQERLK
ncbi:uncharacterized protein LAJ45_00093 [Morchella importuna]|uniref:uncharacterized protein n=1 Tax=Morchella importuna TaxID=1174673 RepID=UPI001E8E009E|nr:uncharacterized protein LAJ45_00093 [Morchella importuna]KAH8155084.1 hypothetical protein LAJ45_00093 [Morchella importuna]